METSEVAAEGRSHLGWTQASEAMAAKSRVSQSGHGVSLMAAWPDYTEKATT